MVKGLGPGGPFAPRSTSETLLEYYRNASAIPFSVYNFKYTEHTVDLRTTQRNSSLTWAFDNYVFGLRFHPLTGKG